MNSAQSDLVNIAGTKLAAQAILNIISLNPNCSSGILGVNKHLDIVSCKLFDYELHDVPLSAAIDEINLAHTAGIMAFEIVNGDEFISNADLNEKLKLICEANIIELIDVLLIGDNSWVSLRQHNRL